MEKINRQDTLIDELISKVDVELSSGLPRKEGKTLQIMALY